MPEGPEVYILAKALKGLGFEVESFGKHILIKDWNTGERFDISFGLVGTIVLKNDMSIEKIIHPTIPSGDMKKIKTFQEAKSNLGIDWMTASKEEFKYVIESWGKRKKQIGALLLDQHEISGIGVAWASEILYDCKISPYTKANLFDCLQLNERFLNSLVNIRDKIKKQYNDFLGKNKSKDFVNSWFQNLYKIRDMKVYKKGTEIQVSGRTFYTN